MILWRGCAFPLFFLLSKDSQVVPLRLDCCLKCNNLLLIWHQDFLFVQHLLGNFFHALEYNWNVKVIYSIETLKHIWKLYYFLLTVVFKVVSLLFNRSYLLYCCYDVMLNLLSVANQYDTGFQSRLSSRAQRVNWREWTDLVRMIKKKPLPETCVRYKIGVWVRKRKRESVSQMRMLNELSWNYSLRSSIVNQTLTRIMSGLHHLPFVLTNQAYS